MPRRGRPPKLNAEQRARLSAIVEANRTATLDEIAEALKPRTGVRAHAQMRLAALREAVWERLRDGSGIQVEKREVEAKCDGDRDAHRRLEPEQTYPSCLTDADWALVADLFDTTGARGVPPTYERRQLVNACCYVVLTGCSWGMLPKAFPGWQDVDGTFRR